MYWIDLRSDTVTQPTMAMRQAMKDAIVGDDVYGDDPTVNQLETMAARRMGKEAALFVVSGTMGNQLAVMTHTTPGQEIIANRNCHIIHYECGSPARLSGDLDGTPGITIIGPKGSVQIKEGLMVAQRHIHMLPEDAARMGVHDGQVVSLEVDGIRGGILRNIVRVTGQSGLECHIDTEEANALGLSSSSRVKIVQ